MAKLLSVLALLCISICAVTSHLQNGPRPGGCAADLRACCSTLPELVKQSSIDSCKPPAPAGPTGGRPPKPPPGGPPSPRCVMQCMFYLEGFLTSDNSSVDLTALNAYLDTLAASATGDWPTIIAAAKTNCTSTALTVPANSVCSTSSCEVFTCLNRYMINSCPAADRNTTTQCTNAINKLNTGNPCSMSSAPPQGGPPPPPPGGRPPQRPAGQQRPPNRPNRPGK